MARIIIHAWFPHLAAERVRRTAGGMSDLPPAELLATMPLVLTSVCHGADLVDSVCRLAWRQGLRPGMRLADARALRPALVSQDSDADADAADLLHLARWARRYCPLTAPAMAETTGAGAAIAHDGNGIWLDVAGAAHLKGGVRLLLAEMARALRAAGLTARLAVAPTCGAAWALARYGSAAQRYACARMDSPGGRQLGGVLAGLPLAALRLDGTICTAMAASGLRRIGDILGMPRAPLASRFGSIVTSRLDMALGHVNESFAPIAPPEPLLAMQTFVEPVIAPEDIRAVIGRLAGEIAEILDQRGLATRRLQLGWQRVDGAVMARDLHLSRPRRDAAGFRRLLADAGEAINPDFGLERMWMEAHDCSPQAPVTTGFNEGISISESRASLIDRLVARLGHGAVLHMKARDCWQPEASQYMAYPDMETPGFADSMNAAPHSLIAAPRPIRLLAHPHRLAVVALLPDHPPAQFVWHRTTHRIIRASGPERIAPQWWNAAGGTRTRDYFRLQDDTGACFWVYREGLPERGEDPAWYLHGFFA
ncbi:MAG: Y-family DNA polymerase [Candidatus Puniceispirillaceae bacterium]